MQPRSLASVVILRGMAKYNADVNSLRANSSTLLEIDAAANFAALAGVGLAAIAGGYGALRLRAHRS